MAQVRNIRPGYTVIHPNRDKASCKVTKAVVVLIMIVSIALMLALTIGGWSELEGLKPVNFVWCIVYAVIGVLHLALGTRAAADRRRARRPAADHRRDRGNGPVGDELV